MLANMPLQSFIAVSDLDRASTFYGAVLRLPLMSSVSGAFAVFDAGGTPVRVTVVPEHVVVPWTVLGWSVPDAAAVSVQLGNAGVTLATFDGMTDADGIWTTPGGDRVAWFRDPDGNLLSITEFSAARALAREVAPIFPVRSVSDAIARFERLGFDTNAYGDDDDPVYGFAERDGVHLHLARSDDHDPMTTTSAAYLYVDNADALFAEWNASGVGGHFHQPGDTDYGLREGAYVDPDGNLIRFGSFTVEVQS